MTSMTDDRVIDTNVLVYAYGEGPAGKRERALALVDRLVRQRRCAIPCQVLAEFFNVVTRKGTMPMGPAEARQRLEVLVRVSTSLPLTPLVVVEAARGVETHSFSYYDAQIWAVARLNQIPVVLSEDFSAGSVVEGIRFCNPFSDEFELERL